MRYRGFLPWLIALALFAAVEGAVQIIWHPNVGDRSTFLKLGPARDYLATPDRSVLFHKMELKNLKDPAIVFTGDSSGFYGIMPEVVEQYTDGEKVLNLSCCANVGWHGYLAILEHALKTFKSIKVIVLYISPNAMIDKTRWRGATNDVEGGQQMSVLGNELEDDYVDWRSLLNPPSGYLRPDALGYVMRLGNSPLLERDFSSVNLFRLINKSIDARQGYMVEHDNETLIPEHGDCTPSVATFETIWGGTRSYLDAALSEFAQLGRRYGVKTVLMFHPSPCTDDDTASAKAKHSRFMDEINGIMQRNPTLIVPRDIAGPWPPNFFSVPAHVQNGFAVEASRRFGRSLNRLIEGAPAGEAPPSQLQPVDHDRTLNILRAWMHGRCAPQTDMTPIFKERCDNHQSCSYPLGSDTREPKLAPGCNVTYYVDFYCPGGPVRHIRQEREHSGHKLYDGEFRLDCRSLERFDRDPHPYGIDIVHARWEGPTCQDDFEWDTAYARTYCDGKQRCELATNPAVIGDPTLFCADKFRISYYCGRKNEAHVLELPLANYPVAHLDCSSERPEVRADQ